MATFIITPSGKHRAQVRHKGFKTRTKTFPTKALAKEWAARIEAEIYINIAKGTADVDNITLADLIDWFLLTTGAMRTCTKTQRGNLSRLAEGLGHIRARALTAADIVEHTRKRRQGLHKDKRGMLMPACGGATMSVELTFLTEVLNFASAMKKIQIDGDPVRDARLLLRTYKLISKPNKRDRRPTIEELAMLRAHFESNSYRAQIPMNDIIDFAIGTARRESEITRLAKIDINHEQRTIKLSDVKHPKKKQGNTKTFPLLNGMYELALKQENSSNLIFPYNPKSISAAFTRACIRLNIIDLHFHDLRHEATSRLFEDGYSIEQVAMVTLHESWEDLKRYAQIKPESLHRDEKIKIQN